MIWQPSQQTGHNSLLPKANDTEHELKTKNNIPYNRDKIWKGRAFRERNKLGAFLKTFNLVHRTWAGIMNQTFRRSWKFTPLNPTIFGPWYSLINISSAFEKATHMSFFSSVFFAFASWKTKGLGIFYWKGWPQSRRNPFSSFWYVTAGFVQGSSWSPSKATAHIYYQLNN